MNTVVVYDSAFGNTELDSLSSTALNKQLPEKGGTRLFPLESFLVKKTRGPLKGGEVERAASWARILHERVEPSHMAEH